MYIYKINSTCPVRVCSNMYIFAYLDMHKFIHLNSDHLQVYVDIPACIHICVYIFIHTWISTSQKLHIYALVSTYGVATISRLLKIIRLFCKRALKKRRYSAKETHDLKEPTNRSHPISHQSLTYIAMFSTQKLHMYALVCTHGRIKCILPWHT